MEQRSPEWFAARKGRLTASSIGAVMGLDPYRTRDDVMRSMVREYHGAESEFTGNVATEWGVANEAGAIAEFEMETGLKVRPSPFYPYGDRYGASPDGEIGNDALIEVKCPFSLRKEGVPTKSAMDQPHYYMQMQMQMLVTGAMECYFYQWSPQGARREVVTFDREAYDELMVEADKFMADFAEEIDNLDHLEDLRVEIDTPDAHKMMREYQELAEAIDNAKDRRKDIIESIAKASGGKNANIGKHKLTRVERKGSVSYAKVVKEHAPDVDLEPYRGKSSEYWKLT